MPKAERPRYLAAALVGAVLLTLIAVALSGQVSGIFTPDKISDPGVFVRWGLPLVTVLTQLAMAVTMGGLIAVVCLLVPGPDVRRALVLTGVAAAVWTVLALITMLVTFMNVLGGRRGDTEFGAQLASFVLEIPLGRTLLAVVIIAALVSVLALGVSTATGAAWTLALAFVPLALGAMTGHTSGAAGHNIALSAMFLHLLGAAAWIGTLAVLALLRLRGGLVGLQLGAVVARFSALALWAYAMVAVSGVISAVIRVGSVDALTSRYAILIAAKVGLTLALGALGWAHRRNVMERLRPAPRGVRGAAAEPVVVSESAGSRLFWRLTAVELLVMGAVSGVAAALGRSNPPVPNEAPVAPTPSQIIMGELLPPPMTFATWFTQWRWEVIMAFVAVSAVIVYTRWYIKLRRRGDTWPILRLISWWTGMLLFFWITSGGPAMYGHILFSAHMIAHMVLVMVIPIFLVMAAPVTLALRGLPGRGDGSRGPREWILILVQSRLGHFFAHPLVAALNFAGSMIIFYYSPLFDLALRTHVGHIGMIVHFTLAGYLFVNSLVGIDPGPTRPGYPMRIMLLFATMTFHAFFGVTLMSSYGLLVPEWFGLMGRTWGVSAIEDQQTGGAITWGIGEIPTMMLAIIVAVRWSRDDERVARRRDRRVAKVGDVEMDDYNDMLASLATREGTPPQK